MKALNHNTADIETLPAGEYDVYYYKKNSFGSIRLLKTQVTVTDLQVSQPPYPGQSPFNDTKQTKEQDMQSQAEQILKQKEIQLSLALEQSKDLLKTEVEKHKATVKENKETQVKLNKELYVTRQSLKAAKKANR